MMLAMLVACTSDEAIDSATPAVVPAITRLSPADGDTVCRDPLPVVVDVEGLELVTPPADATQAVPGTGHIDVTLNGQDADMVWQTSFDVVGWTDPDGAYQLKVELSNADHSPVDPYAGDFVYITLSSGACG